MRHFVYGTIFFVFAAACTQSTTAEPEESGGLSGADTSTGHADASDKADTSTDASADRVDASADATDASVDRVDASADATDASADRVDASADATDASVDCVDASADATDASVDCVDASTGWYADASDHFDAGLPNAKTLSYWVSTLVGNDIDGNIVGYHGEVDSDVNFNSLSGIAFGPDGSLYFVSQGYINKIAVNGTISTYAGTGFIGNANGPCADATFANNASGAYGIHPMGVAVDANSNVYATDSTIRLITPTPCEVTTLAEDVFGYTMGGLALDAAGNIYVGDTYNNSIQKVTPNGNATTLANNISPQGITIDAKGNLYVTEPGDILKIATDGQITTLAGGGIGADIDGKGADAVFNGLQGITIDANGNLFVTESYNHIPHDGSPETHINMIRKVTPDGDVTTIAGQFGVFGDTDGPGNTATFYYPWGIAVDSNGILYVADYGNRKIRKLTPVWQ